MRRSALLIGVLGMLFTLPMVAENLRFEWPLIKGQYPDIRGISSTFGESRYDRFHTGLDIASESDPVQSMADGKILYSRDESDYPFKLLPGPGNLIIIDHGAGWWSGYFHLESLARLREGAVTKDTVIGFTGNTGRSGGAHLHFFLSKDYGEEFVNPLDYLPGATDENAPVVQELIFFTEQGKSSLLPEQTHRIRLTKAYPVHLNIRDPGLERSTRRGVYALSWSLNGKELGTREFRSIRASEKGWLLGSTVPYENVFTQRYYNLGPVPFENGQNVLTVKASDYSGNVSTTRFNLDVQREF